MTRWLLHEYRDRYDPLSEPRSVGVYEDAESVIRAVASLKQARPKCLPIALIEGKRPEVLHVVHKADEWDSLFQSVELAYSWIEWQWYEHQRRPPGEVVRYSCTSILVDNFPAAEAPKTVWQWLRSPAPYSFDDA